MTTPIPLPITSLTVGDVLATDVYPAVDVLDDTQSDFGTTKKYTISDLVLYVFTQLGLNVIPDVRVATDAALTVTYDNGTAGLNATITNAGVQAALEIDGEVMAVGDRFLVKDQAAPAQNGIYVVTTTGSDTTNWVATRPTDFNTTANIIDLSVVLIQEGDTNANIMYQLDYVAPLIVGTTALPWTIFALNNSTFLPLPISLGNGGTSKALTAADGGIVYSDADSMEILAPTATAGQILRSGANSAPSWSTASFPDIAGALGTIIISDGSDWITSTSLWPNTVGAAGKILRSDGTTNAYSTSTFADTYAINTILYAGAADTISGLAPSLSSVMLSSAASTGVPTWSGALTDGQLIIGSTGATPVVGSLSAGAGISIAAGAGTITISGTGSGIGWNEVVASPQAMTADTGYIANTAGLLTFTLPVTAAFGTAIDLIGKGAGGWIIAQNAGQNIQVGSVSSTIGVGGSVASTNRYDSISLICTTADTTWTVLGGPQSAGLTIV